MENHNSSLCNGELRVGPWGGEGGDEWSYRPKDGITKITVSWCSMMDVIHSLIFHSQDGKTEKFGGRSTTPPTNEVNINIDYPNEFLTGISGHTYRMEVLADPSFVIGSLKFYTNRTAHGPFGYEFGDPFFFCPEEDGAMITGFFGRDGYYLDAIGVYYKPILKVPLIEDNSIDKKLRNPGPWGGYYGKVFDDGVFCGIKKIHVHLCTNKGAIAAIRFEYVNKKGDAHWSPMHGAAGGTVVRKIEIDTTNEFLIGVQGFYGKIEGRGDIAITSLTFYTNKGKYGPLGREIGKFFSSVVDNAKVVGFFGKCGELLNAIGMHTEYL